MEVSGAPDYTYGNLVSQLRFSQLAALLTQVFVLYIESGEVGLCRLLLSVLVILYTLYAVGVRWVWLVDGRQEFSRLLAANSVGDKLQCAYQLSCGLLLAVLLYIVSPALSSGFQSILFGLSHLVSIGSSLACIAFEVSEAMKH